MIAIHEHAKIEKSLLEGIDLDGRINYDTSRFVPSKVNLIRYEADGCDPGKGQYSSYFRIGAEWLDNECTRSVVVTPKMQNINFLEMFVTCLHTSESADRFSSIYDIDIDAPPIRSKALSSILSALLVAQFLTTMQRIVSRGLRKGYVSRGENLSKVKGRLDILRSERNAMYGRKERVFCRYEEYQVDTPENRLLKRALTLTADMISLMREHSAYPVLTAMLNHCTRAFAEVSDEYAGDLHSVKTNKLYREYDDAIRLAKMILRRQDIAISRHSGIETEEVPVFRIDMALLFEHYILSKLRNTFGHDAVMYQVNGSNPFIADFLLRKGDLRLIVDTKYVLDQSRASKGDYIKQLSGYSRDYRLLKLLGYEPTDEDSIPVVPCLIIYPDESADELSESRLFSHPVKDTVKFYTLPVSIPTCQ